MDAAGYRLQNVFVRISTSQVQRKFWIRSWDSIPVKGCQCEGAQVDRDCPYCFLCLLNPFLFGRNVWFMVESIFIIPVLLLLCFLYGFVFWMPKNLVLNPLGLSSFEHHPPLASCLGLFPLSLVADCSWMDEKYAASY